MRADDARRAPSVPAAPRARAGEAGEQQALAVGDAAPAQVALQPGERAVVAGHRQRGLGLDRVGERSIDSASFACARARTAARPVSQSGKKTHESARARPRGRTRTVASVSTPRRPSEPSTASRRSGPAPRPEGRDRELAARRLQRPPEQLLDAAVAQRLLARRARHDPAPGVESSNDCGKWPSVMPCARSALRSPDRRAGAEARAGGSIEAWSAARLDARG